MSLIRLKSTDGLPRLVDTTEILDIKQEIEVDQVYHDTKFWCIITYKNGMQIKVSDKIDDIEEMINQLTQW